VEPRRGGRVPSDLAHVRGVHPCSRFPRPPPVGSARVDLNRSLPTSQDVMGVLRGVVDPGLGSDIVELGMVRSAEVLRAGVAHGPDALTTARCPLRAQIKKDVVARLESLPGVTEVRLHWGEMTPKERSAAMATARLKAAQRPEQTSVPLSAKVVL